MNIDTIATTRNKTLSCRRDVARLHLPVARKVQKSLFFPWVGPWGNHVENCIDRNSFWFFQNASLHIPIYLQQFLTQGHPKVKKSPFLFPPGYAPGAIRLKVASIERASNASKMPRRIYPSIFNSFRDIQRRIMSWPWNLVSGRSRSLKIVPQETLVTVSYSTYIATMVCSRFDTIHNRDVRPASHPATRQQQ